MIHSWFRRLTRREFVRYGIVGVSGLVVDLALLVLLHEVARVPLLAANIVSFLGAVLSNHLLNTHWTFTTRARRSHFLRGPLFLGGALVGLGVNELGLWLLSTRVELFYIWAKLALVGVVFAWNYAYNSMLTFRGSATPSVGPESGSR